MMRKTFLILILLTVVMTPFSIISGQDQAVSETVRWPDLGGREILIAVDNGYPPYSSIDENGEGVGWDYDTFSDICMLLNCVPVFQTAAWDGLLIAIGNGEYDVTGNSITYTAERDETVDFGMLYQAYDQTLLVREDENRFTTAEELAAVEDFKVGTQVGTTNEITAGNIFGAENVVSYETFPVAIEALLNNDIDAVVIDRPAAVGYIEARGDMKTVGAQLAGIEGLAFVFPPGSDLITPFNAAISALQASGRWDEIYAKWFETETAE